MTSSFAFPRFALALVASGALCLATTDASAEEPAPPLAPTADASGSHAGLAAGITLTVIGPLAIVGGGIMSFVGLIQATSAVQCGVGDACPVSGGTGLLFGGLLTTGAGIAATVIGAILIGDNSGTNRARASASPATASIGTDPIRRPIWNAERPIVPATPWTVPVIATSF